LAFGQTADATGSRAELLQRLNHFTQAHFRAQARLQDFDRELDEALAANEKGLLQRSTVYQELLALRALMENDVQAFTAEYKSAERDEIEDAFAALNEADQAVAYLLIADAAPELAARPVFAKAKDPDWFRKQSVRARVASARVSSPLDLEIAEIVSDYFLPSGQETAPEKSPPVRPGVGPEGNMYGTDFPVNTWALTFDDGPHPTYTLQVIAALESFEKKASFFWLAENVVKNAKVVKAVKAAGMSMNDHSYTHLDLSKATSAQLKHEVADSYALETKQFGKAPLFFRCPYGAGIHVTKVRQAIADLDMVHVFWTVDSLDWQDPNPDSVLARVKKEMALEKRGIILFHDIHPQSVAAAKLLLEYSRSLDSTPNRLRWVTMPQIMDELNSAAGEPESKQ
jgi:peptidoglycan/xylan/chitin deacetylase (PgdA/CDA1 family)